MRATAAHHGFLGLLLNPSFVQTRMMPQPRLSEAYCTGIVAAQPGVTPKQLRVRIRAALPNTVEVRTGAQQAAKNTKDLESNLSFLRTFLLVFAYVSLVVGAFIIFNTFSITVAQRTREFGLLRTLGSSRAQIMRAVIVESLMLGALGGVLGLFGGIGLMGGAMLRDFAIVATAFEVQATEARSAGMIGAVALLLGTLLPFIVGASEDASASFMGSDRSRVNSRTSFPA